MAQIGAYYYAALLLWFHQSVKSEPTMMSITKNIKFCWICGKDVDLEHCIIDEHGLSVHQSCQEKRVLLKAESLRIVQWKEDQSKSHAA